MNKDRNNDAPRRAKRGLYLAVAGTALLLMGGALYCFVRTERGFRFIVERIYRSEFPDVRLVSPEELASELEGPAPPLLLDTRAREEYAVSHLEDARLVVPSAFGPDDLAGVARDTPIVVYCSVGYRSGLIAGKLAGMGFRNVRNLYGGIFLWFNQERPVFSAGRPVDRIHTYDSRWGRFVTRGEGVEG